LGTIGVISLESSGEGEGGFADIPNSREPVANGETVPVAICFHLLLFGICDPTDWQG